MRTAAETRRWRRLLRERERVARRVARLERQLTTLEHGYPARIGRLVVDLLGAPPPDPASLVAALDAGLSDPVPGAGTDAVPAPGDATPEDAELGRALLAAGLPVTDLATLANALRALGHPPGAR